MALRITVDIFSGRPNPVVTLAGDEERDLLERLAAPRAGRDAGTRGSARPPRLPPSTLGYRGLLIEHVREPGRRRPSGLPARARVAAGWLYTEEDARPVRDPGLEDQILSPTGPLRLTGFGPEFSDRAAEESERFRWVLSNFDFGRIRWPLRQVCRCAPLWEPAWWNDAGTVQWSNNCYNYGTNYRSDTYAQPGLAAGAMYGAITCAEVRAGAIADALLLAAKANNRCPKEGHLVALVVGPGWDFHWYRKGRNGYWTHKPGGTPATDRDNSGHLITDPRTADRGGYTDFCTFMVVMHGHVKVK
ncbi:MAG: hypothetical protein R3E98_20085 [Gemmatimonadota bacterium]